MAEKDWEAVMSNFKLTDGKWKGVQIAPSEAQALIRFIEEHAPCQQPISIAVSGGGISQNVVVDCAKHPIKSQTDITDYSLW
jgi:hypothetical protein